MKQLPRKIFRSCEGTVHTVQFMQKNVCPRTSLRNTLTIICKNLCIFCKLSDRNLPHDTLYNHLKIINVICIHCPKGSRFSEILYIHIHTVTRNVVGKTRYYAEYVVKYIIFLFTSWYISEIWISIRTVDSAKFESSRIHREKYQSNFCISHNILYSSIYCSSTLYTQYKRVTDNEIARSKGKGLD